MNEGDTEARGIVRPRAVARPFVHDQVPVEPPLDRFVKHLWWVRWRVDAPFVQHTIPFPSVHLVFEAGEANLQGPMSTRFRRELVGEGEVVGVHFRPAAFRPLWGRSLRSLRDRRVPAADAFGPGIAVFAAEIASLPTLPRVEAVEEWLANRLPPGLPPELETLARASERLLGGESAPSVAAVARDLGVSERTLQRRFMDAVGWTPREVLLRHRIHEALWRLDAPDPPPLAELAIALGYCDQAHFSREFKRMVGMTPGAYRG